VLCPRCQTQNREGAQFCRGYGARLEITCLKCHARVEPDSRFSDTCGVALSPATASTASSQGSAERPTQFGPPDAYTPKHLVEKILTSRSSLEGERKQSR
jgi:hypothetical protein